MTRDDKKQEGKKAYEPPACTAISLRPEEAVLGSCKSMVVSGPSAGPSTCGIVGCNSIGS